MNGWMWSDAGFLLLAAVCGTLFMVIYTARTVRIDEPWWGEKHRAHLGWFTLALTALLWIYVFRAVIPTGVFVVVRRIGFDTIALLMVWRLWLMLRAERAPR